MRFLWPDLLWLLLLVPVLVGAYLWLLRRKKKAALRYASLALVRAAMTPGGRFRRHVPPLLFLVAMTLLLIAIARPAAVVTLPTDHETIVLAIDVSGSMRANDIKPTRLEAAQVAARAFINDQPRNVDIGLVSFAGTAAVVQAPSEPRRSARRDRTPAIAARHGRRQRPAGGAEADHPRRRVRSALRGSAGELPRGTA
jgi:Ca-activated chloride channel family protein